MATLNNGNAALNRAEAVHAGVNAAVCVISISASGTTSAGDVLRIGKLPNRAIPLEVVFYPGAAFVTNTIHKFGVSASDACFLSSRSYSSAELVIRGNVSLAGLQQNSCLSRSDDAVQRFSYITHTPSSVLTAGQVGTLVVFYKLPGQAL